MKKWKKEPALFEKDKGEIDECIDAEKAKLKEMELIKELIELAEKNAEDSQKIQKIAEVEFRGEYIMEICYNAIERGLLPIIYYAIKSKPLLINYSDGGGNTPYYPSLFRNNSKQVL